MEFIYGKQDWKSLKRGEENCYLMANELGGFSSLSMIGSCSRSDHSVLTACLQPPNQRIRMIHRIEEKLNLNQKEYYISSQKKVTAKETERGYLYLDSFQMEIYPVWRYLIEGVYIKKTMILDPKEHRIGLRYEIQNHSKKQARLEPTPKLQFVKKAETMKVGQRFEIEGNKISSQGLELFCFTNGSIHPVPLSYEEGLYYRQEIKAGNMRLGSCAVNHRIHCTVPPKEKEILEIVYSTDPGEVSFETIKIRREEWAKERLKEAEFSHPLVRQLVLSADQFIAQRESTKGKTILAGYPHFEDWGRDTMIALPGCCLACGRYETAEQILDTFLQHCRRGIMPNLFPEGGREPMYNTADASLLFILAVYRLWLKTGKSDFVKKAFPIMEQIVSCYARGTDFHIKMDKDGLLHTGEGREQLTWMDICREGILPTPRQKKPVEINAYWYNALKIMEQWDKDYGKQLVSGKKIDYKSLADKVRKSFGEKYWNEKKQCLRDVLSRDPEGDRIRCNQIWAVSLPFSLLSKEQEKMVVQTVFQKLYTVYGLRTLEEEDEKFHGFYGGDLFDRDMAYHQGSIWMFPLGAFYEAWLKVNDYSKEAISFVEEGMKAIEPCLRHGCIGQLPELFDGKNPVIQKGCYAQAWSVGEILRIYDLLREYRNHSLAVTGNVEVDHEIGENNRL